MYNIKFKDGIEKEFESLEGADLKFANLKCANLSWTDLSGANLSWTDLSGANLRDANLKCANLTGANLSWTDLSGANLSWTDLRGADLDYSVLPLWCGGLNMKIDTKIARQLVYHAFAQECDDPEYQRLKELCKDFANKFHRVESKDCEKIGD